MNRRKRTRQVEMQFRTWGGKRRGAGRKPVAGRRRVPHTKRPKLASRFPVHVTTRIRAGLPSLRKHKIYAVIRRALLAVAGDSTFRVCEFSVQREHIHFICEAKDADCLGRGMKRLKQVIARGINAQLTCDGKPRRRPADGAARTGSVFGDRYHAQVLRTPRQVRNALCYVIHNARKHRAHIPVLKNGVATVDPYTSAWWFDGWRDERWKRGQPPPGEPCVAAARTWLLATGWRRHGLIQSDESPALAR